MMQIVGGKEVTEKKTWSYWHLSDYKWMTYKEYVAERLPAFPTH